MVDLTLLLHPSSSPVKPATARLVTRGESGATVADVVKPCATLRSLRINLTPKPPSSRNALIVGALTVGIGPAIVWPIQFSRVVGKEREIFQSVSQWAASRAHPEDARCMDRSARRIGVSGTLLTLGWIGVLLAVVGAIWGTLLILKHPLGVHAHGWATPMHATYLFLWDRLHGLVPNRPAAWSAYGMWAGGLMLAYCSHWVQVHRHARAVRCFLNDTNRFLVDEGGSPAFLEPISLGFAPVWRLTGFLALIYSSPWGLLLTLAGATQQRYQRKASVKLRAGLLKRVRELVLNQPLEQAGHPLTVSPTMTLSDRCDQPGCLRPLPARAKFCPKCGAKRGTRELDS